MDTSNRDISTHALASVIVRFVLVYAVVDDSLSRHLLGDSVDVFVRREDAERFVEEVRGRPGAGLAEVAPVGSDDQ